MLNLAVGAVPAVWKATCQVKFQLAGVAEAVNRALGGPKEGGTASSLLALLQLVAFVVVDLQGLCWATLHQGLVSYQ